VTVDEAISDLLSVSTDIRYLAVLDAHGELRGAGPSGAGSGLETAAIRLWEAAAARACALSDAPLEHVVVHDSHGAVAMVEAHGRRIVAVTGLRPAAGLLIFDLRTCLSDAFSGQEDQA
jgi:hypothetical protein